MIRQQIRCLLLLATGVCFLGTALAGEDFTDKSGPGGTGPAWYQLRGRGVLLPGARCFSVQLELLAVGAAVIFAGRRR